MKTATIKIQSASPYSQSRIYTTDEVPMLEKESKSDYEIRTWRNKQHFDKKTGEVYIPPMQFKNCLMDIAQYLGEKIPGKGNSTWTKHFMAGVLCSEPIMLGVNYLETDSETFMCHADGKRSCGTRVPRTFPVIREWKGVVDIFILDETITRDIFQRYISEAGKFIGIGRFRPRNGGFYGRFSAEVTSWN